MKLSPPNIKVSTGEGYKYHLLVGDMQTVEPGAQLMYEYEVDGMRRRRSAPPNSWASLGGISAKSVR